MKVEPLEGDYCPDCAQTLATGQWKAGSIVPLCKPCLNEMIKTHDLERAQKFVISIYDLKLAQEQASGDRAALAILIASSNVPFG